MRRIQSIECRVDVLQACKGPRHSGTCPAGGLWTAGKLPGQAPEGCWQDMLITELASFIRNTTQHASETAGTSA